MPTPKGKSIHITCYVDADHAHDKVTQRSVTSILLFINGMTIKWISRHQKTVESSTYGRKMVAACIASKLILEVCYKLWMLWDNLSVIMSTSVPSSVLKKKHQVICYHWIWECIAAKILWFVHVDTKENLADCLTKPLPNKEFLALIKQVLFCMPSAWVLFAYLRQVFLLEGE